MDGKPTGHLPFESFLASRGEEGSSCGLTMPSFLAAHGTSCPVLSFLVLKVKHHLT